jgi:hypothetical protein
MKSKYPLNTSFIKAGTDLTPAYPSDIDTANPILVSSK